ncbi:chemotaxis-specific protein-glutamate methyltransferase CheB [Mesoterricola silvestris]|uniref:Protein-glutamate methylesterase/protein-glutamine glutaminase n=1 Tax=Mesoterricola silvestris TaxID=2927979 RepID=A0AA48H7U9_9BACT|nr:chemotaxis-specific protein-glutamate methyltransferase CheB [Mesoterricola silvestris]BDU73383.1 chemotaxis response regulator protein-glutamate methylesterase [Mesoterricola silvestris]
MPSPKLRILIVDDTAVYRRILTEVVESLQFACEITACPSGRLALQRLDQAPADLVLLDVEMPDMGGIETLRLLRARHPGTGVIMISGTTSAAAAYTVEALALGAMEFVQKPEGVDADASRAELRDILRPLVRHVQTRANLRFPVPSAPAPAPPRGAAALPAPQPLPPPPPRRHAPGPGRFEVLGIGVSTGGPNALGELIPALPANLSVPVLVVQHMPPLFTASLAEHLNRTSRLPVHEAVEGEPVVPGRVYIAPGGRHMVLRRGRDGDQAIIGLNENPPENSCRPSVDVLFRSMAAHYGGHILAVVMTGMGSDGCEGVRAMKRAGCHCLTQSEDTCVVYGMPLAVDEAGLSDERVPLPLLAHRIASLLGPGRTP